MIGKLKRKFTAITMLSLFLLLVIIMVTVNLLNYRAVIDDADTILDILAENGGAFPEMGGGNGGDGNGEEPPEKPTGERGNSLFRDKRELRDFSPEVRYETRFFSVSLDESGNAVSCDLGRIAAVDESMAVSLAEEAAAGGKERGFIRDYRYLVKDGLVVFIDASRSLDNVRSFLLSSALISVGGLLLVFLIVLLVSGRVIRPISESYEKQKRFITDAGHEIKTPIAIINADAEVIELESGESEWTDDIKAQTKRLAALTDDLIFLSKMEEDVKLTVIEFPLSDLAEEAAKSFESLAKTQSKSFTYDIEPNVSVTGDQKGIRQLMNVLLDNAIKYSPEGGKIRLELKKSGRGAYIAVSNTAEGGISREKLSHMFDRFYRGDASRSEKSGYGIGLSIAKAVVEAHKGKISASTPDGKTMVIEATI